MSYTPGMRYTQASFYGGPLSGVRSECVYHLTVRLVPTYSGGR